MKRKLYITYRDHKQNIIFEGFIHKIDAVKSHTVIYKSELLQESDIIRLPFNIKAIQAIDGKVTIYYFYDMSLEIERRHA